MRKLSIFILIVFLLSSVSSYAAEIPWSYGQERVYESKGGVVYQTPQNNALAKEFGFISERDLNSNITRGEFIAMWDSLFNELQLRLFGDIMYDHIHKNGPDINDKNKMPTYLVDILKRFNNTQVTIINGDSNKNFNHNSYITRAEIASISMKMNSDMNLGIKQVNKPKAFIDNKKNAWYYNYVSYVQEFGIMNGVSDKEFAPNKNFTWSQAIYYFNNIITKSTVAKFHRQDLLNALVKNFEIKLVPVEKEITFMKAEYDSYEIKQGSKQIVLFSMLPSNTKNRNFSCTMNSSVARLIETDEVLPKRLKDLGYQFVMIEGISTGNTTLTISSTDDYTIDIPITVTNDDFLSFNLSIEQKMARLYKNLPKEIWLKRYPYESFNQFEVKLTESTNDITISRDNEGYILHYNGNKTSDKVSIDFIDSVTGVCNYCEFYLE